MSQLTAGGRAKCPSNQKLMHTFSSFMDPLTLPPYPSGPGNRTIGRTLYLLARGDRRLPTVEHERDLSASPVSTAPHARLLPLHTPHNVPTWPCFFFAFLSPAVARFSDVGVSDLLVLPLLHTRLDPAALLADDNNFVHTLFPRRMIANLAVELCRRHLSFVPILPSLPIFTPK